MLMDQTFEPALPVARVATKLAEGLLRQGPKLVLALELEIRETMGFSMTYGSSCRFSLKASETNPLMAGFKQSPRHVQFISSPISLLDNLRRHGAMGVVSFWKFYGSHIDKHVLPNSQQTWRILAICRYLPPGTHFADLCGIIWFNNLKPLTKGSKRVSTSGATQGSSRSPTSSQEHVSWP